MMKAAQVTGTPNSNSNNNNNNISAGGPHSHLDTTHGSKDLSNTSSMTDSPESSVRILVGQYTKIRVSGVYINFFLFFYESTQVDLRGA